MTNPAQSARTASGIIRGFQQGEVMATIRYSPAATRNENGELGIDKKEVTIVRRIFAKYLAGKGKTKLVRQAKTSDGGILSKKAKCNNIPFSVGEYVEVQKFPGAWYSKFRQIM